MALTLEMDPGHENMRIGFYSKFLQLLLRISSVVDYSHIYMQKELFVRSARNPSMPSLRFTRNKPVGFYSFIGIHFYFCFIKEVLFNLVKDNIILDIISILERTI